MRVNFGLNLAAGNGIDTETWGILNSEYIALNIYSNESNTPPISGLISYFSRNQFCFELMNM